MGGSRMKWRDVVAIISSVLIAVFIADMCTEENTIKYWIIDFSILVVLMLLWEYIFHLIDKKKNK